MKPSHDVIASAIKSQYFLATSLIIASAYLSNEQNFVLTLPQPLHFLDIQFCKFIINNGLKNLHWSYIYITFSTRNSNINVNAGFPLASEQRNRKLWTNSR